MISIDFNGEKFNYVLILSWFCSLTFNLFKRMIYDINDRLQFYFYKKKMRLQHKWSVEILFYKKKIRLLMIEEWDEGVQSNKEDP